MKSLILTMLAALLTDVTLYSSDDLIKELELQKEVLLNLISQNETLRNDILSNINDNNMHRKIIQLERGKMLFDEYTTSVIIGFDSTVKSGRELIKKMDQIQTTEDQLFQIQINILENEQVYNELIHQRRILLDQYAQLEFKLVDNIEMILEKYLDITRRNINQAELELMTIEEDIELYNKLLSLKEINAYNFENKLIEIYDYVLLVDTKDTAKNNTIISAIDIATNKVIDFVSEFDNHDFISFSVKSFKNIKKGDEYSVSSIIMSSINQIDSFIIDGARQRYLNLMFVSFTLDKCVPIVKMSLDNDQVETIDDNFYIRCEPLSETEYQLYALSQGNNQFNDFTESNLQKMTEDLDIQIVNESEKDYIWKLLFDNNISNTYQEYLYFALNLENKKNIYDRTYLKVSPGYFNPNEREKAEEKINMYWSQSHPRRFIFKYSVGLITDYWFNVFAYDNIRFNFAGYGNDINSILMGFRFRNNRNYKGDDSALEYIGLRYNHISRNIYNAYQTYLSNNEIETPDAIALSCNELQFVYNLDNYFEIGLGYGKWENQLIINNENNKVLETKNLEYGNITITLSIPIFNFLSWDFAARVNIPTSAPNYRTHGSLLTTISLFLLAGRF